MPDKKSEEDDAFKTDQENPSNLQDAIGNLVDQLGKSSNAVGTMAARELDVAISVASDIRDNALNNEVLAESRNIELLQNVRNTAHNVVDLGFDVAGISFHLLNRSLRLFLSADRKGQKAKAS